MGLKPTTERISSLFRDLMNMLVPAMIGLLVVVIAAAPLAHRLARPIRDLAHRMQVLPVGPGIAPIGNLHAPLEIREPARAYDQLIQRLTRTFGQLKRTLVEHEHIIEERTSALKVSNAKLHKQSITDELTGVLNYRGLNEALENAWRSTREQEVPLLVLCADIDLFKPFNDRYGHPAGDSCLKRVASAMRSSLLNQNDVLGRVGGEEFVVLIKGLSIEQGKQVAERIRFAVANLKVPHADSPSGHVTISLGIAVVAPNSACNPANLLVTADEALYRAKRSGRNCISQ